MFGWSLYRKYWKLGKLCKLRHYKTLDDKYGAKSFTNIPVMAGEGELVRACCQLRGPDA